MDHSDLNHEPFSLLPRDNPNAGSKHLDWRRAALQSGIDGSIDPSHIEDVYIATPFQQGVLHTATKSKPPGRFFIAVYRLLLPPHTDLHRLRAAWNTLVNAHSVLRTGFCLPLSDDEQAHSGILALVFKPGKGRQGEWHECIRQDLEQTMMEALGLDFVSNLAFEPFTGKVPLAVHVVGSPRVGYHLRLCLHHSLFDGATIVTLLRSFHSLYHQRVMGGSAIMPPTTTFAPVADIIIKGSTQDTGSVEAARQYWRRLLQDLPSAPWPPTLSKEDVHASQPLSAETLFRYCAIPPHTHPDRPAFRSRIIRTALVLAMSLHSGLNDHLFCETRSSRSLLPPNLQTVPGPCLSSQIVRLKFDPTTRLEGLMCDAGNDSETEQLIRKAPLTLGQILEAVGGRAKEKIRVFLTVYAKPFWLGNEDVPGWQFVDHWTYHDAPLNIDVFLPRNGAAQVRIRYDSAISQAVDVHAFADHFVTMLGLLSSSFIPTAQQEECRTVRDVFRVLGDMDSVQALRSGTGPQYQKQKPDDPSVLSQHLAHELFEACARSRPSAIALQFERTSTMTYSELDARATDLAVELREKRGVGPDVMVPILFDVSFDMIVAILAVMKAGGAYVPLGVDHPIARLEKVLEIAGSSLILCGQGGSASTRVTELKGIFPKLEALVCSVTGFKPTVVPSQTLPPRCVSMEHLAYVLFTSGSTGVPKGVGVEHRNLSSFLRSGQGNAMASAGMRKLLLSPYTFDISVGDIFSTLTSGGTLGLVRREELLSNLPYWLEAMRTTHLAVTPSVGRQIPVEGLPHLTHIIFVGETLPVDLAARLSQTREVHNTMGPTECVIDATEYVIPKFSPDAPAALGDRVPIGYPIGTTNIYILRPSTLDLTARGEVGEICIGGDQVSRGYVTDAELSKSKFVPDPFSGIPGARMFRSGDLGRWNQFGQIEHLGRMDGQVKLRGLRIETGEIEHVVLKSSPDIHAVYADVLDMANEQRLVAVFALSFSMVGEVDKGTQGGSVQVIPASDETVARTINTIDRACAVHLPPYMRPSFWLCLDNFPKDAHGKLDRRILRSLIQEHASVGVKKSSIAKNGVLRKANTEIELAILAVLAQVLGRPAEKIDLDSSFLSLGGTSLQAMRLTVALQAQGVGANVSDCLDDRKTVAMLAALPRIKARGGDAVDNSKEVVDNQRLKSKPYARFSMAPDGWEDGLRSTGLRVKDVEDVYPCTSAAQAWVDLALNNQGRSLLCQFHHDLGSDIDASRFAWCWEQLRLREPALRTVFVGVGNKATVTAVVLRPEADCRGAELEMVHVADGEEVESLINDLFAEHRLELGKVPIRSWLLFNKLDGKWAFASSRHHSLHDASTLDSQGDDLSQLYVQGEAALPEIERKRSLESSFGAFMYSLARSDHLPQQRAFWHRYLYGAGPSVWPPPSKVPTTFCKDLTQFGFHITEWRGSLQEVAQKAGVTKGAVLRGAYAIAMAEMEGRSDTIVYETVEGRSGAGVDTWGFCTHFDLTRIQVPLPLSRRCDASVHDAHPDDNSKMLMQVVREANRSFAETLPNIGAGWDMATEILGAQVEPNCKFQTSILNILDMSGGNVRKDKKRGEDNTAVDVEESESDNTRRGGELNGKVNVNGNGHLTGAVESHDHGPKSTSPLPSPPRHLFSNSLLRSSIVGVYLPLCVEIHIMKDRVAFACPYDPTLVKKEEMERLVQRQIEVLESLSLSGTAKG